MSHPRADTMPAVTVPPGPNGLPTASTQSPTRGTRSANFTTGKIGMAVHLDQGNIGTLIDSNHLSRIGLTVAGCNLVDASNDVVVGHESKGPLPPRRLKTSSASSMSRMVWSALIWKRISSSPFGTTG
jgi:hypothetical protein